jgi:hypothetical protein
MRGEIRVVMLSPVLVLMLFQVSAIVHITAGGYVSRVVGYSRRQKMGCRAP